MRVTLKGKVITTAQRKPAHIVFLVDVAVKQRRGAIARERALGVQVALGVYSLAGAAGVLHHPRACR